jgi:tetratricopeptide (TPR) repeat protein
MKRGIALLEETRTGAIVEALACFDRALALRSRLPVEAVPRFRFGLAACWLNRADALMRLHDPERIPVALRAYDKAIALLKALPLGDDVRFPRRLAIAHQNQGLALQQQGGTAMAIAAFTEALAVLESDHARGIADRPRLLAAVSVNLANALASAATPEGDRAARDAAIRALALVADLGFEDADAAEADLNARHVLCRTIARQLSLPDTSDEILRECVHGATDLVDDGLRIVRHWERSGVARFRRVAYDLFRFGARVYAAYQPHFLQEFVLENMDPTLSSADDVAMLNSFATDGPRSRR